MAEYQKLQQKNGILKRAVVDEQQKRSSLELKIKVFFAPRHNLGLSRQL
jgi:hypothetical protein